MFLLVLPYFTVKVYIQTLWKKNQEYSINYEDCQQGEGFCVLQISTKIYKLAKKGKCKA